MFFKQITEARLRQHTLTLGGIAAEEKKGTRWIALAGSSGGGENIATGKIFHPIRECIYL
jgi:hypothetical protein